MKTIAQIESYEAKIQRAMASIKKLGDGVYSVASESESAPHVLTTANDQVTYCTCKGWNGMYHKCYHSEALNRHLAAQRLEAEAVSIAAAIQAVDAIVAEDEQEAEVVAAVAEAQKIVTAPKPAPEYIRMKDGSLVQKSAQRRYRWRGTFDLYR